MRVVLLVTDLERGGTPLRLARLAHGLHDMDVEVHVGCLAPPGPVSGKLEAADIPTFACNARHSRDLPALWRLVQHLRRIKPDLIHATLTHANIAARLVGFCQNVPVLTSTATIEIERRWHRFAERLTGWLDHGHIVNSQAVAEHVARAFGRSRDNIYLVPPSLDTSRSPVDRSQARAALDLAEHEFVILWAGRLDPVKRVDLIIKCAELMKATPARFLIAGDGPDRTRIERLLQSSSASQRVRCLGWRDDLDQLLAAADVFLFPSRTEGLPNAVLQAMSHGLPIVASDIPSLYELSGDNQRLLLVAGDNPQAFVNALMQLHEDPQLRQTLGERAAAWAEKHLDPCETIAAVLRVYRDVLNRCPA